MAVSQDIVTKVNTLMHEGFEIPMEQLTPSATLFDQLGLDSLDVVDMLVHLEENLKVKVDAKQLTDVRTLQDVYEMVAALAVEPSAAHAQACAEAQVSH